MLPKLLANKVNTIFKPNPSDRIKRFLGCKIKLLRQKTNTYIKTPGRGDNPQFVITGKLRYNSNKRSLLLLIFIQYTIRKCKMWSSFTHNTRTFWLADALNTKFRTMGWCSNCCCRNQRSSSSFYSASSRKIANWGTSKPSSAIRRWTWNCYCQG